MTPFMTRPVNRLSVRTVQTLKKPGRHADGHGLYLHIDEAMNKRWVFVFQWRQKRREMGLGSVTLVSLLEAREARDIARKQVSKGINPIEARRVERGGGLFSEVALEVIAGRNLSNPKHAAQWETTLRGPLWDKPVFSITVEDVLEVLRPIWTETPETAKRTRQRIEAVLDAAKVKGLRSGDNPARWKGHLQHLLTASKREVRHHPAIPYKDLPAFWKRLKAVEGSGSKALQFTILTAARTGETIGAPKEEVKGDLWTISAERMKARKEHVVPLTATAKAILEEVAYGEYLFVGRDLKSPLSNMAMESVLRRMGAEFTVHGMRSTFKDWASETTDFPNEIVEMCLAHTVGNKVERSYRRGTALAKRREVLIAWEAFVTRGQSTPGEPHGE
jgi:integrase